MRKSCCDPSSGYKPGDYFIKTWDATAYVEKVGGQAAANEAWSDTYDEAAKQERLLKPRARRARSNEGVDAFSGICRRSVATVLRPRIGDLSHLQCETYSDGLWRRATEHEKTSVHARPKAKDDRHNSRPDRAVRRQPCRLVPLQMVSSARTYDGEHQAARAVMSQRAA